MVKVLPQGALYSVNAHHYHHVIPTSPVLTVTGLEEIVEQMVLLRLVQAVNHNVMQDIVYQGQWNAIRQDR